MVVENKIKNFKDLKIWHKGIELVKLVYQITDSFPASETYGLVSQMRRSAVSIPSNIAEGFMRRHNKEFKHFLYITLGSLAELETQIILSEQLGFMNAAQSKTVQTDINELDKMITALIKCL
jgi:four helix bundle protein